VTWECFAWYRNKVKPIPFADRQWSDWFRALDVLEQEWFDECVQKREELQEEVQRLTDELHRLKARGAGRTRRWRERGVA